MKPITSVLLLLPAMAGIFVTACTSTGTPADQSAAGALWGEMADYSSWGSFEGHEGMEPGKSPHGKFIRTFVNDVGARSADAPAFGTIIVKENFSKNAESSLNGITVMQRIEGFDPENNDWFWARYTPKGKLTHAGKVPFCADCHFDAGNDDYVFLND